MKPNLWTLFAILLPFFCLKNESPIGSGPPLIQVVVKITMEDGKTYEGFKRFGPGSLWYGLDAADGFFYVRDGRNYFEWFRIKHPMEVNFLNDSLLFAEKWGLGDDSIYPVTEITIDSVNRFYTKKTTTVERYRLSDSLSIYTNLPMSMGIGYPRNHQKGNMITLPIPSMAKFEFLKYPSEEFIKKIKDARERIASSDEAWEDYQEPVWYHEIMNDKELLMKLRFAYGAFF